MNSDESSPEISNDAVANVSRNPLTNLRTLFKRKTSAINLDGRGGSFGRVLIVFSVLLNLIFLWLVISLGNTLFVMKETLAEGLLEGVASSLALSENAQIETIININEQIPLVFDLVLQGDTLAVLFQPTRIDNVSLSIRSANLSVDAPASITFPAGAELPITLDLTVPVNVSVPIELAVPVAISLANSDLGEAFQALQRLVGPYEVLQSEIPGCWQMLLWQGDCP
ncbi:MAG: hypothetical protein IIC78_06020 [Chloroflexi bacterium]|nr:hypothetical protein [Chloroflexota bacterium]